MAPTCSNITLTFSKCKCCFMLFLFQLKRQWCLAGGIPRTRALSLCQRTIVPTSWSGFNSVGTSQTCSRGSQHLTPITSNMIPIWFQLLTPEYTERIVVCFSPGVDDAWPSPDPYPARCYARALAWTLATSWIPGMREVDDLAISRLHWSRSIIFHDISSSLAIRFSLWSFQRPATVSDFFWWQKLYATRQLSKAYQSHFILFPRLGL